MPIPLPLAAGAASALSVGGRLLPVGLTLLSRGGATAALTRAFGATLTSNSFWLGLLAGGALARPGENTNVAEGVRTALVAGQANPEAALLLERLMAARASPELRSLPDSAILLDEASLTGAEVRRALAGVRRLQQASRRLSSLGADIDLSDAAPTVGAELPLASVGGAEPSHLPAFAGTGVRLWNGNYWVPLRGRPSTMRNLGGGEVGRLAARSYVEETARLRAGAPLPDPTRVPLDRPVGPPDPAGVQVAAASLSNVTAGPARLASLGIFTSNGVWHAPVRNKPGFYRRFSEGESGRLAARTYGEASLEAGYRGSLPASSASQITPPPPSVPPVPPATPAAPPPSSQPSSGPVGGGLGGTGPSAPPRGFEGPVSLEAPVSSGSAAAPPGPSPAPPLEAAPRQEAGVTLAAPLPGRAPASYPSAPVFRAPRPRGAPISLGEAVPASSAAVRQPVEILPVRFGGMAWPGFLGGPIGVSVTTREAAPVTEGRPSVPPLDVLGLLSVLKRRHEALFSLLMRIGDARAEEWELGAPASARAPVFDAVCDSSFHSETELPKGEIYRSKLFSVVVDKGPVGEYGRVDFSRAPFSIRVSTNQLPPRAMIALAHELAHICNELYKMGLSHGQVHELGVFYATHGLEALNALARHLRQ